MKESKVLTNFSNKGVFPYWWLATSGPCSVSPPPPLHHPQLVSSSTTHIPLTYHSFSSFKPPRFSTFRFSVLKFEIFAFLDVSNIDVHLSGYHCTGLKYIPLTYLPLPFSPKSPKILSCFDTTTLSSLSACRTLVMPRNPPRWYLQRCFSKVTEWYVHILCQPILGSEPLPR